MTLKIIKEKKNPLLKREEVRCIFEHPNRATPSREEMLPVLEKALKTKRDLVIIDKIFSIKGKGESKLHVFVYKNKEDIPKEKIEKMQRRMKRKAKAEKEQPAEETKSEEKKEASEGTPEEAKTEKADESKGEGPVKEEKPSEQERAEEKEEPKEEEKK